ncbi:MAG TPA: Gfo/Idh/MocA family oxidoreductase [Pirellulaceae bacterium]|nr:Gfo/Idh/MocA family oxidoreductase [Pirellulaceae bacterium]
MTPVRTIVVGAGHLGTIHTRLLTQNQRFLVAAVVEPNATTRERIEKELGVRTYERIDHVKEDFSAAIIATPTIHHHKSALPLIHQGIHCLIEKPLALTVEQATALVRAAQKRDVVLQVGHNERFNAAFVAAKKHLPLASFIETVRTSSYTFRSTDVGVVLDLMIHDLDLVLSLVNSDVAKVSAFGRAVIGPHEDFAHARLEFENGCVANLSASRCSFERQRQIRWYSEDGFVTSDLDAGSVALISVPGWVQQGMHDMLSVSSEEQSRLKQCFFTEILPRSCESVTPINAIEAEHHDFCDAIRQHRLPLVDGEAGHAALLVANQILEQIQLTSEKSYPLRAA